MDDCPQISRILKKLPLAKSADPEFGVFGARAHRYVIHAPASAKAIRDFESRYAITLPEAYKRFLLGVGNGGIAHAGSGAGPFYGIYELGAGIRDVPADRPETVLAKPCVVSPGMANSAWTSLISSLGLGTNLSDEAHDEAMGALFGGLLPIGSQGCTYLHCLVLNGPFAGRVVNVDLDYSQPPVFAYESDFLAWYERWLDEVIAGDLSDDSPSWFGYVRGGTEAQLLDGLRSSQDSQTKQEFLTGLLVKRRLTDATLNELVQLHSDSAEHRSTICQIVCKYDHARARPLLMALGRRDPRSFLQCLHWYARDKIPEWQDLILSLPEGMVDEETFRFFTYVLELLPVDRTPYLTPFTHNEDGRIRSQAFYALGKVADRHRHLACFFSGLDDLDSNVVRVALQALAGLKDPALLPHYRKLAKRFPEERDYVLTNLDRNLAEVGLSRADLMREDAVSESASLSRDGLAARGRRFMRELVKGVRLGRRAD
jgi:hypothetical protein